MATKKTAKPVIDTGVVESWTLTIGRTIKNEREKQSINQSGLADSAGISRGTVSHIENGSEGAGIGAMVRSLLALGIDPWSLFGGKTSARPGRVEVQILRDLVDEIAGKGDPKLTDAVREVLKSFAARG